jgi:predicted nucleotidyltransferase
MEIKLSPLHQVFVDRFLQTCQADSRVLAACLIGSYAKGKADPYSDLDLMVITADDAYEEFYQQRESYLRTLGDLVFLEDFGLPDIAFFIFADGIEGELYFGSKGRLSQLYDGPFLILLDKYNILSGITYSSQEKNFDVQKQAKKLRFEISIFWHELSHFITAMGRGQLWWAQGQLESLRSICVSLARLQNDFSDTEIGDEPYFKIEDYMQAKSLAPLRATFCPLEREAMLQSAQVILSFYGEVARSLTKTHGISYPEGLESVMRVQLKNLQGGPTLSSRE